GFLARAVLSMWPVVVMQTLIIAYYSLVTGPMYYLLFYALPIVTVYPAQIRLRSLVEHSFEVGFVPKSPEDYWVTRSTRGSIVERFIFSPIGIHHHFEHHLFPSIPHYNLKNVQKLLVESGF